jgi:hypothetical protein
VFICIPRRALSLGVNASFAMVCLKLPTNLSRVGRPGSESLLARQRGAMVDYAKYSGTKSEDGLRKASCSPGPVSSVQKK